MGPEARAAVDLAVVDLAVVRARRVMGAEIGIVGTWVSVSRW